MSEWTAGQISDALRIADEMGFDRIVSNQPQYSMLWRVIEEEVVPVCQENGIGQIVWSPLAQGVLTGKYAPGEALPPGTRATSKEGARFIERWLNEDILQRVQDLRPIAADLDLTLPQLALAWVLQNRNVSAAIIGATRASQVHDNVKASGVERRGDPGSTPRWGTSLSGTRPRRYPRTRGHE